MERITIAIDAMGGDNGPMAICNGVRIAKSRHGKVDFRIYGNLETLRGAIPDFDESEFVHTDKFVRPSDKPSAVLRHGQDTSMYLAIQSVQQKQSHACVSAGNTGALMAVSRLLLKRMSVIRKPAICSCIPNGNGFCVLLDMGANIDCDPSNYLDFAVMGDAFLRAIIKKENGRIGILNIGTEAGKGGEKLNTAYNMIRASKLGAKFIGYVEPQDIFNGAVDVVVTDGFSGNIFIKSAESVSMFLKTVATKLFSDSILAKLGYLLASNAVNDVKRKFDHRKYNGAMFVGLDGISVKSHGNTDDVGFAHAIDVAISLVRNNINDIITENIKDNTFLRQSE